MTRKYRAYFLVLRIILSYKWASWRIKFIPRKKVPAYMNKIHKRNASKIYNSFVNLKGLYIKLGQLISILATSLPQSFRDELIQLQDKMPPTDYEIMKKRLKSEWKKEPKDILKTIDPIPIAAASIGQVHRGVLKTGEEVVIKIQYPGLEKIMDSDLKALKGMIRIISFFFPDAELRRIYNEVRTILLEEIDFKIEADNMEKFSINFKNNPGISAPKLYRNLSTSTVLVSEFIDGVKINDIEGLKKIGTTGEEISTLLIESFAIQLFDHGFYHADPHPGNLLVKPGPNIVFIDFGAACDISENTKEGMVEFVQAGVRKDTQGLVKAMRKMGFIAIEADPKIYARVVSYFHDKFHQEIGLENLQLGKIKFTIKDGIDNINNLKKMNITLKDMAKTFHIPREWVLLERTFLILMGIVTEISPELDIYETFIPHIKRFSLQYGLDPSSLAITAMRELAINAFALPAEIRNILERVSFGEVELKWAEADRGFSIAYYLTQEVFFGVSGWTLLNAGWRWEAQGFENRSKWLFLASALSGYLFLRAFTKSWSALKKR
jgi:ubiquinone biosynthesis protein